MRRILVFSLVLIVCVSSCKKKEEPAPTLPSTSTTGSTTGSTSSDTATGSMVGKVSLLDAFGKKLGISAAGVRVGFIQSSAQQTTDASGSFTLTGVRAGTYTLIYIKEGFGSIQAQNIVYKPGDKAGYDAELAQLPSFSLTTAAVKDTTWFSATNAGIYYKAGSAESNTAAATVAIISGTINPNIAVPESYDYDMPVSPLVSGTDYNRFVSYQFLKDNYGYYKNQKVYIKIYPVAAKAAFYSDLKLKRPVYTAVGDAYVQSFTVTVK